MKNIGQGAKKQKSSASSPLSVSVLKKIKDFLFEIEPVYPTVDKQYTLKFCLLYLDNISEQP